MVEQNLTEEPKLTRQERRRKQRDFEKMKSTQRAALVNRALWQIIMANGGSISVTQESLTSIPNTAALQTSYDAKTDMVKFSAGHTEVVERSNIILPRPKKVIGNG